MTDGPLLFRVEDSVAWLTLNRPDAGNAIDQAMADALLDAAIRCDIDEAVRCVVLTGAGRLFCAGGDIGSFASAMDKASEFLSRLAGTLHMAQVRLLRMAKPLVVLVNGPAAGAGMSLALSGDIVIGTPSVHFTPAYGGVGLTPDGGMTWLLPRLVGMRRAQDIIISNRRVMAEEAERIGLVTRLVDASELAAEGERVAGDLARSASASIAGAKALLLDSMSHHVESQMEREVRAIAAAGATPDFREGVAAFAARRKPQFGGK